MDIRTFSEYIFIIWVKFDTESQNDSWRNTLLTTRASIIIAVSLKACCSITMIIFMARTGISSWKVRAFRILVTSFVNRAFIDVFCRGHNSFSDLTSAREIAKKSVIPNQCKNHIVRV